jgi:hypothetical protein
MRVELISANKRLVATYSRWFRAGQIAKIFGGLELRAEGVGPKATNKLPKTPIMGVCGNLIGN